MNPVDKVRLGRAFSRGAAAYDALAGVQRLAQDRLLELALPLAPPRRILDVGAGTGALLARLSEFFPAAELTGVDLAPGMASAARARAPRARLCVADAEELPFRSGAFELVCSTSTLQWLPRLDPALAEAQRTLAPGGTLAIAFFTGATLHELRHAWRDALPADAPDRTHRFHQERELGEALARAGLVTRVLASHRVVERYPDALALLRALKRMGAGNAVGNRDGARPHLRGLEARAVLERMARLYQARHGDGRGVPATWEIVFGVARK